MASSSSGPSRPSSPPSILISFSPSPPDSPTYSPPDSPSWSPLDSPPSPPPGFPMRSPPVSPMQSPPGSPMQTSPMVSPTSSPPRDPSAPLRDPFIDPSSPPLRPSKTYYEQISAKRRRLETNRDESILQVFQLRPTATALLESNGVESLQNLIHEFAQTPKKKRHSNTRLFTSLAFHYPNAFCFKLAKILSLHPPLHIRNEVVSLLRSTLTETHGDNMRRIDCPMLSELKNPLLESFKVELEEPLLAPLSEVIGNVATRIYVFSIGGWVELLEYIVSCFSSSFDEDDGAELKRRKGLMLLADLPVDSVENAAFWKNHYGALYANLMLLVEDSSENLQELFFNALLTLLGTSKPLGEIEIGGSILPLALDFINEDVEEETLMERIHDLQEFVSLDVSEILDGKEYDVFHCMLRIAETKGASEELKCAAVHVLKDLDEGNMDVMEKLILELSDVDVQRLFKASMDMMLSITDDPLWLELDKKDSIEAGVTECFRLGKFLLNWLSFEGDGNLVVPMAIELVKTTYAVSIDWRKRHAGAIVISAFADGHQKDIIKRFEEVERLLIALLNDQHHRVLWAVMNAIRSLSEYKIIPHVQYHLKFLTKLVAIIQTSLCPQVQVQAVRTIRSLVTNCRLDRMAPSGEGIVTVMLELLKNDKQKLQEEAVETLKSIAALIPTNFHKCYDTTMESLKAILFHDYSTPKFLLRAKSLECMSSILLRMEFLKFTKEDAVKVMDCLVSLEGKLSSTDYLVRIHILKALDQFCRFPGVDLDKFINKLMPMLLRSAQLDIDLKANMPANDSLDDNFLVENERVCALNILSHCAVRSSQVFSAHICRVSKIFASWLDCSSSETRKASVSALPSLLLSVNSGVKNAVTRRILPGSIVQSLVEALHEETDDNVFIRMVKTLPKCIQISGSAFHSDLIKIIADETNHILSVRSHNIIEREIAREAGNSEGGSEYSLDEEIIQSAKVLITAMAETFNDRLLPYVDDLLSSAALLWGNHSPVRLKAIAVSIFNTIVPQFPNKLQTYLDLYTYVLLKSGRDGSHHAQLETVRGIGICAKFGGEKFQTFVNVALSWLYSMIEYGLSIRGEESEDGAKIYDMAVSALGKICEFHRGNIDGPEVIRSWLNFLPLTSDLNEAREVHGQLSKLLRRSDPDVLGPNKENLPKIISILRDILVRNNELATEETFTEIVDFLDKHDPLF